MLFGKCHHYENEQQYVCPDVILRRWLNYLAFNGVPPEFTLSGVEGKHLGWRQREALISFQKGPLPWKWFPYP